MDVLLFSRVRKPSIGSKQLTGIHACQIGGLLANIKQVNENPLDSSHEIALAIEV